MYMGLQKYYVLQLPLEEKIETIAKEIYGADGIEISAEAQKRLDLYKKQVTIILPLNSSNKVMPSLMVDKHCYAKL